MPRLREELDESLVPDTGPTTFKTEINKFEVPCGVCGAYLFVDEKTLRDVEKGMRHDVDSPFICPECEEDQVEDRG